MNTPNCPKCQCEYTYIDNEMIICPECSFEFKETIQNQKIYKDAFGNILSSGDSVIVTKDLKVKGTSLVIKKGTKVKNIRLSDKDHDIDCKIDGIGAMELKTEFVKKI